MWHAIINTCECWGSSDPACRALNWLALVIPSCWRGGPTHVTCYNISTCECWGNSDPACKALNWLAVEIPSCCRGGGCLTLLAIEDVILLLILDPWCAWNNKLDIHSICLVGTWHISNKHISLEKKKTKKKQNYCKFYLSWLVFLATYIFEPSFMDQKLSLQLHYISN